MFSKFDEQKLDLPVQVLLVK